MSASTFSPEEKRHLNYLRQRAVKNAWKNEQTLVYDGNGTRDWTVEQQKELMETGRVEGYEGHHMKSVSLYPEYAGDENNIQFLSEEEHFYGAHQGNYQNATNGYYDPNSGVMNEFDGDELQGVPTIELTEKCGLKEQIHAEMDAESDYMGDLDEAYTEDSANDYMGDLSAAADGYDNSSADYSSDCSEDSGQSV